MTPQEFCYWLQGHFELTPNAGLNAQQVAMVKKHLDLVFENVTREPEPIYEPRPLFPRRPHPMNRNPTIAYC